MEDKAGWKADMLMEKLRAKQANIKSLQETSKTLRLTLMDKRQTVDAADRAQLQRSLELLQHKVKLHSLQGTLDRLEAIAKQLGMSYRTGQGQSCFIECDMFYVELELHVPSGQVREVRLQHEADAAPQPCPELAHCLTSGDYQEFTAHLEGLLALYKLNADRKLKARAYPALRALESDLARLAQLQTTSGLDAAALVHRGPVGILQHRRLGHPMRLTYMVTPYQLLDGQQRRLLPLTVETVSSRRLGLWVEVMLQSATAHKLQTASLVNVEEQPDGQSIHSFAPLGASNSCTLPAAFVLKLSEAMPISADILDKITEVTQIRPAHATPTPLLPLICQSSFKQQLDARHDQKLYVRLPDQLHCYYLESSGELGGALVEALPFTHPAHVAPLLALLRTQALFNTLVASCVRPGQPKGTETSVCLEVTALSVRRLAVAFEHPREDGLACLDLELSAGSQVPVSCRLQPPAADVDGAISRVLQRCLSIPVTMRALLRRLRAGTVRGDARAEPAPAPGSGGSGTAPDAPDGPGDPPRSVGGSDRGANTAAMAYEQFQSMSASFTMNQLQALWPSGAAASDQKHSVHPNEEPAPSSNPAKLSEKPAPAPPSEMESIEATVRQMERERSRRPDPCRDSPARADKRASMDVFSLPGGAAASIPSSLTITAIPSGGGRPSSDADRRRDRRDKERSEKKRRREESPASAGRTDARTSSGRDRGREGGGKPLAMRHGAEATASPPSKKHSSASGSSPSKSHNSSSSPAGKSASPVPKSKSSSGSSSSQQSLSKHSFPSHSPKHSSSPRPPSVSPKHSSSPKQQSTGKPSLSSLRSPSPSHRTGSSSSSNKSRERSSSSKDKTKSARPRSERDSESASAGSRPASLPGAGSGGAASSDVGSGSAGGGGGGSESRSPGRGRKGSLSDVISKLNTLASGEEGAVAAKDAVGKDGRRAEFTVKPSSEGIKLTINKTKSRASSSSPSGVGSRPPSGKDSEKVSPSGLKPGSSSGPASKKTFAFPKQMSSDAKTPSSMQNDLAKSMSSKLLKRPDSGGTSVRPKTDRPKLDKLSADLTVAGDLPPLPKSLEIRKIERPPQAEPPADEAAAPATGAVGPDAWPPAVSKTGSDAGDTGMDVVSSPCPPPPPRPPPRAAFPPSPSVQIRIVKSPAPVSSPHQLGLVNSPRSAEQQSPCVIDDELMDEALVGLGK